MENEAALGQTLDVLACSKDSSPCEGADTDPESGKMPSSSESWRRESALVGWFDLPDPNTGLHPNTIGKPVWEPKMLDGVDDQTR